MTDLRKAKEDIIQAFRKNDVHDTKVISREALLRVARGLELPLTEAEFDTLLAASGLRPGEAVPYEPFVAWLCAEQEEAAAPEQAAEPVPEYVQDFFPYLFGFNEHGHNYGEVRQKFAAEEDSHGITLLSKANGRRFRVGSFDCPSLRTLREEEIRCMAATGSVSGTTGVPLQVRHIVTTGALEDHAEPANSGALFQVASQFNCLEFTSSERTPEEGVSWYVHDATQGPACAVACAPATVYRNYLVPVHKAGQTQHQLGQTSDLQLNLLEDLEALLDNGGEPSAESRGRYFWIRNGYVCSDPQRLEALRRRLEELGEEGRKELRNAIKIGLGIGSEVVFKALVPFEGLVPVARAATGAGSAAQRASQVFCAAANVRSGACSADDWEPFARLLLEATYEAALWAGVRNARLAATAAKTGSVAPAGSRRVVLTSVGGGVFGNRPEWITDAMNRALRELAAQAPAGGWGLEVCVAHFQELNPTLVQQVSVGGQ